MWYQEIIVYRNSHGGRGSIASSSPIYGIFFMIRTVICVQGSNQTFHKSNSTLLKISVTLHQNRVAADLPLSVTSPAQ